MCSNVNGSERLVDTLYSPNASLMPSLCTYGKRLQRHPNVFAHLERAANSKSADAFVMYPPSDFTANEGCKDWFFASPGPSSRLPLLAKYSSLRIPTSGISRTVFYSPRSRSVTSPLPPDAE